MATFYRGIALNPQTDEADRMAIRETGRLAANARWRNTMAAAAEVRRLAADLAKSPAGAREAINALPQAPLTYACARFDDAAFYARRERRKLAFATLGALARVLRATGAERAGRGVVGGAA
jgi:hypothetical protein